MSDEKTKTKAGVKSRQVFFISAFDPRGARAYWSLYRKDSRKQSHRNDLDIRLGTRKKIAPHISRWQMTARKEQDIGKKNVPEAHTDYDFLHWDDIIRAHWIRDPKTLFIEGLKCNIHFGITSSTFWTLLRKDWKPTLSGATPFLLGALTLIVALLFFKLLFHGGIISFIIAATLTAGLVYAAGKTAGKYNLFWILRGHIFFSQYAKSGHLGLSERIKEFGDHIYNTMQEDPHEETLIVTHCMGANVGAEVLAYIHSTYPDFNFLKLTFISLGQVIPWFSYLPEAEDFHKKLEQVAQIENLHWVDISAPPDTVCFAECGPLSTVKVEKRLKLDLLSPRFHTLFDPLYYTRLKRDRLHMHFQYLMASGKSGIYDYFRLTAGLAPIATHIAALKDQGTRKADL